MFKIYLMIPKKRRLHSHQNYDRNENQTLFTSIIIDFIFVKSPIFDNPL